MLCDEISGNVIT